jgi:hypothetical protein
MVGKEASRMMRITELQISPCKYCCFRSVPLYQQSKGFVANEKLSLQAAGWGSVIFWGTHRVRSTWRGGQSFSRSTIVFPRQLQFHQLSIHPPSTLWSWWQTASLKRTLKNLPGSSTDEQPIASQVVLCSTTLDVTGFWLPLTNARANTISYITSRRIFTWKSKYRDFTK